MNKISITLKDCSERRNLNKKYSSFSLGLPDVVCRKTLTLIQLGRVKVDCCPFVPLKPEGLYTSLRYTIQQIRAVIWVCPSCNIQKSTLKSGKPSRTKGRRKLRSDSFAVCRAKDNH